MSHGVAYRLQRSKTLRDKLHETSVAKAFTGSSQRTHVTAQRSGKLLEIVAESRIVAESSSTSRNRVSATCLATFSALASGMLHRAMFRATAIERQIV